MKVWSNLKTRFWHIHVWIRNQRGYFYWELEVFSSHSFPKEPGWQSTGTCTLRLILVNMWFIFGRFQVIIPCSWIFAWTFNIPLIMVTNFDKETGDCKWMWPEQWMGAANETTWLVGLAFIPLMVMTGLYSRVVHMLWFKRNNGNDFANRQRVRA